jgi:hypothetical protein
MTRDHLIAEIEAEAAAAGLSPATVTSRAVGNSRLYARLRAGKGCTLDVAERLLAWIRARRAERAAAHDKGAAA